jgi:hypothetical protein
MAEQYIPQNVLDALPKRFETKTVQTPTGRMGGGFYENQVVVPPPNAIPVMGKGPWMPGGARDVPTGEYYIPLDIPNYPKTDAGGYPVPPLVAKYDASGKLQTITAQTRYLADTANNIAIQPEYNLKGELVSTNAVNNAEGEGGGFGDFLSTAFKDFAPMIALGLGANYLAPLLSGGAGAAGAAGGASTAAGTAGAGTAGLGASTGTGLTLGGGSGLGLTAGGGGLGLTAGSAGAGTIGAGLGSTLAGITTGVGAGSALGSLGAGAGGAAGGAAMPPVDYGLGSVASLPSAATTGAAAAGTGLLDSLGGVGTAIMDFAKANPSIAGSLLGAVAGAVEASNAPKSATTQSNIDPELKAEYLANIARAKETAAGLQAREIAQPGKLYTDAESKLYNLGMTPFGAADIERFFNPYQEKVVQGALSDIERTRQMQEQANMEQATRARAFGGSRQGVVSGMTNEAALRQAATTGAQLRSAGFNTAANLGLAARPMDIAGLQTSLGLGTTRTALEQARLDALRNLGTERLAITSGSLGIGLPNVGGSTSQPLYSSTAGSALSGGLTGAYIGSLLQPR